MFRTKQTLFLNEKDKATLQTIGALFHRNNYEFYLVGGCVRDLLLDRTPKDIDLCTNATPEQVEKLIKDTFGDNVHIIETGLKHGTVTIYIPATGLTYEITTYRVDGKYTDGRHPDVVTFTPSLEEDLKRRDLTINSFAYDLLAEEIVMLDESFLNDLKYGIIRTVGKPEDRFNEDALRMMRAIRFAAQLGFTLESETFAAIRHVSIKLSLISKERVRDELIKILMSDRPEMLEMFIHTKLEEYIPLPLSRLLACKQHNKYHYTDVLHHTFDVIKKTPKDAELRLAALFHDFGKPDKETTDENGYNHYYEHELRSADLFLEYAETFKLDNDTRDHIYTMILHHNRDLHCGMPAFKRLVRDVGVELFPKYLKLREADGLSHNLFGEVPDTVRNLSLAKERYAKILTEKAAMSLKDLAIDGYDVMSLGFRGKEIGDALNRAFEYVTDNPMKNTKEDLLSLLKTK